MSEETKSNLKSGKTRITIRLDSKIVAWFKQQTETEENLGSSYQALINDALLKHIENQAYSIEETIRQTIREEIAAYAVTPLAESTSQTKKSKQEDAYPDIPDDSPFKEIIGMFDGGPGDSSQRVNEIVMAEISKKYGANS